MKKRKPLFGWALLLASFAMFAVFLSAAPEGAVGAKSVAGGRSDIIVIDGMASLGSLELPGVTFKHDQHTEALAKQGQDCSACHLENTDPTQSAVWNFKFKRAQDTSYAEVKEIYHNGCLSCHKEAASAGLPTGPQAAECRSCHRPVPVNADRREMNMDKYLHFTHIEAEKILPISGEGDANCGACHHVFDPQNTQTQLTWKRHEEDACRACHLQADSPNPEDKSRTVPSLRSAAHDSCISCHFTQAERYGADKSGPVNCAGCHSAQAQADLLKNRPAEVRRLDRGQPDSIMLLPTPGSGAKTADLKGSMQPVPFDHKTHEKAMDTCSACHHEGRISSCSSCHTLEGGAKGNFVNLAQAMHQPDSERSCVGCHNVQTQAASCAGCHQAMPRRQSQQSCASCHVVPVGVSESQATDGSLLQMDRELLNRMAASTIRERNANRAVLNMADVPETVRIDVLANEFKGVDLPHRKIVQSLLDGMFENRLAQSFHRDPLTMCQGCHHNSPASLTPPKCASCHAAGDAPGPDGRPPLKVAYHNQCMGCHSVMNIEKPANTDCAGCHAPANR